MTAFEAMMRVALAIVLFGVATAAIIIAVVVIMMIWAAIRG